MKEFVEKLISRLEAYQRHVFRHGIMGGDAVRGCITNVKELAEEYKGGWIPVSERLPVYLDNVLVCTKNGGRTIAHLKHTPIEWRDMYMNKIDDVIAWKYLDAPYQTKGE